MASLAAAATVDGGRNAATTPRWTAVYAMALCTFVLIASEFMPVSLLSPIARSLALTEGQAGQAIAISGIFAVVTSLSLTSVLGTLDRRLAILGMTALLVVSGTIVALAPTYLVLMTGRALLGVAIGGFWSMSASIVMRLVPEPSVARALAIVNGGNALATVIAAPLGSFMGSLIGWRGAFFCVVPIAVAAIIWQAATLPALPVKEKHGAGRMLLLLKRPSVMMALASVALLFVGQFALFTYLRPFLEQVTNVGVSTLSGMLLVIGVAGFVGTLMIGYVIGTGLHRTLILIPVILAAVAAGLATLGGSTTTTALLLAAWGFVATAAPVAWWTWLARTVPDDAEAGGGLMVAIVQLAITLGATAGGVVFDSAGPRIEFLASAGLLVMAALSASVSARVNMRVRPAG
jgi:predicted MFS family arabinose efflux permease